MPGSAASEIPRELRVEVHALAPTRGVYGMSLLAGGIVDTPLGQALVQLSLAQELPGQEEEPAQLAVHFKTEQHVSVMYYFDVTDFLESFARAYFRDRPDDRPMPPER